MLQTDFWLRLWKNRQLHGSRFSLSKWFSKVLSSTPSHWSGVLYSQLPGNAPLTQGFTQFIFVLEFQKHQYYLCWNMLVEIYLTIMTNSTCVLSSAGSSHVTPAAIPLQHLCPDMLVSWFVLAGWNVLHICWVDSQKMCLDLVVLVHYWTK